MRATAWRLIGCGGRYPTDVLALARAEYRAIVTNNLRDYRPLHNEANVPGGDGHFGMIFMPVVSGQ